MRSARLAAVITAVLLVACGKVPAEPEADGGPEPDASDDGPDGGEADGGGPVAACDIAEPTVDELFECAFGLSCEQVINCGGAFSDLESCFARIAEDPGFAAERQRQADAIEAGRQQIDFVAYRTCIDAWQANVASGDCINFGGPEECEVVFTPLVAAGGACFTGSDCAPSGSRCASECSEPEQCCQGTCVAALGEGASCNGNQPCQTGLQCVGPAGGAQICADGDLGAACDADYQCDDDLHCGGSVCVADLPASSTCTRNDECLQSLKCVSGTCRSTGDGDACTGQCNFGLWCELSPAGGPGVCQPLPASVGDDCTGPGNCMEGLLCRDNTCQEPVGAGASCIDNGCLPGFFCGSELEQPGVPATCILPRGNGELCDSDSHCESGVCQLAAGTRTCVAYQECE